MLIDTSIQKKMTNWKKTSEHSIRTEDGSHSIARFIVQGKSLYRVFQHIEPSGMAAPLDVFDDAENAKQYVLRKKETK